MKNLMRNLFLCFLLLLSTACRSQSFFEDLAGHTPYIVSLEGQSNAQGSAYVSNIVGNYIPQVVNNAFIFNSYSSQFETIQLGVNSDNIPPPYTPTSNSQLFFGVEMTLLKLIQEKRNSPVYLTKYGWGGSGLTQGSTGNTWNVSAGNLYPLSNANYDLARSSLNFTNTAPNLYIWIQGEADCSCCRANYVSEFSTLISAKRAFYGSANMPVVVVSLSLNQTEISNSDLVAFRALQKAMCEWWYDSAAGTMTRNIGTGFISNSVFIDQNEFCENQSGVYIHYNYIGYDNIARFIFRACKILNWI